MARTMAFYFKIEYTDGSTDQFWSKPWNMAEWELRKENQGQSFLPADGMPPMSRMYWLAFKAGRDQGLFDDKLLSDWGQRIQSFEFTDTEDNDDESADDAGEVGSLDPTQTEA